MIHANAEKTDFIVLTESWINTREKHQIAEVSLNGYNVFKIKMEEVYYCMQKITFVKINKITWISISNSSDTYSRHLYLISNIHERQ